MYRFDAKESIGGIISYQKYVLFAIFAKKLTRSLTISHKPAFLGEGVILGRSRIVIFGI